MDVSGAGLYDGVVQIRATYRSTFDRAKGAQVNRTDMSRSARDVVSRTGVLPMSG